jgi:putative hemolysin
VLTPAQARRIGSTCSDIAFDLTRLRSLRQRMLEIGRGCVHADHRQPGVMLALWGALAGFMRRNQLDTTIGCASIPMQRLGIRGGDAAASIWRRLSASHLAPIQLHVQPRLPLPVHRFDDTLDVEAPALLQGCLRLGAKVLGPPAWDPDFNSAELPMLMRIDDLPTRYHRCFLGR